MLQIPLQSIPNQIVNITLANQNCAISVYQRSTGLYCDLYVDNVIIIAGVICQNLNRIVRDLYLGFVGDLGFYDAQGADDPFYEELASRFTLIYLELSDLDGAG